MAGKRGDELLTLISALEKALQYTRLNPQILIEMWLMSILPHKEMKKKVDPFAVDEFWSSL